MLRRHDVCCRHTAPNLFRVGRAAHNGEPNPGYFVFYHFRKTHKRFRLKALCNIEYDLFRLDMLCQRVCRAAYCVRWGSHDNQRCALNTCAHIVGKRNIIS